MSASRSLSRRTAVAGLGAGSIGAIFATQALAAPMRNDGSSGGGGGALASHPLVGLWLALVEVPSNPGVSVAVPTLFTADGSAVLFYPATEVAAHGVQVKGAAVGTWESTGTRSGHFTAVQALSDFEGNYLGTVTVDGYPEVGDDGESFAVNSALERITVRNAQNVISSRLSGSSSNPMHGARMRPGFDGFVEQEQEIDVPGLGRPRSLDPRTP
jgi:hypothetical protein